MVIKTKNNDAFKQGIMERAKEEGMDLAIISDHSADDACSKWEGVIISMSGETEGYPSYAEARASNQVFHPNCEHTLHPIRSEDDLHSDDILEARKKASKLKYKQLPRGDKAKPKSNTKGDAKASGEPPEGLHELVKDTSTELYQKIGEANYNGLHDVLKDAPDLQKQVWSKMERHLKVIDATSKQHPHCMGARGVVMDVTQDSKGSSWSNPFQTTVHEFSHNIDYLANGLQRGGSKYTPISVSYKNGLLQATIKSEFDDRIKALDKKMKAEFKENKDDADWLFKNNYMSDFEHSWYKKQGTFYTEPKYKKAYAYSALQREINQLPLNERADLSDIIEGVSGAKVTCGFGHGKQYWKDRPDGVALEAFAEMMDSSIANPKQFKAIEKYFPQAVGVFKEILKVILLTE